MDYTMEQYQASAQAIRERLGAFAPKVAMVLGSGLVISIRSPAFHWVLTQPAALVTIRVSQPSRHSTRTA